MKILLVWPNSESNRLNNVLPLGLGYLSANLKPRHDVVVWDASLLNLEPEAVKAEVERFRPDAVGISVWNYNIAYASAVAKTVRQAAPDITIIAGGPAASGYKEKIFGYVDADYAIAGEGEIPLSALLDWLENPASSVPPAVIPGLVHKSSDGKISVNPPVFGPLDNLKFCDYDAIHFADYLSKGYRYGMHSRAVRTAPITATRGCPFPCEYCAASLVNGKQVRTRTVNSVLEEIRFLHDRYGVDGFNVIDDNFTLKTDYAKDICRGIIGLGLKNVSFNSPNGVKVEYLDPELLSLMKRAGWECLFIAPESGSKKTLKAMKKIIDIDTLPEKIAMIKSAGLLVFGFFMIGYPGEGEEDIERTISYAASNDFDFAVFTCFQPLGGTPVYEKLRAEGKVPPEVNGSDYYNVVYAPDGMSVERVKSLRKKALFRFYALHPLRLLRLLRFYDLSRLAKYALKFAQ